MTEPIRFDDGVAYERFMGRWSQLVGRRFLEWLAPAPGWEWVDVGCGNGAFSALLVDHYAPVGVLGVDPSEAQLAFARAHFAGQPVQLECGHALALPCESGRADAAVMPLVLSFVPDSAAGVAEMVRVVRPGGLVSAYMWDMQGGGFPYHVLNERIRARGGVVPWPPVPEASRLENMEALWRDVGLQNVGVHTIRVTRSFDDFDDFWTTAQGGPSAGQALRSLGDTTLRSLKDEMSELVMRDAEGRVVLEGWANAVRGTV